MAIESASCLLLKDRKAVRVVVALRNSGLTPAFDVTAEAHVNLHGPDVVLIGSPLYVGSDPKMIVGHNTIIFAEAERGLFSLDDEDVLSKLSKDPSAFVVTGGAEYRDIFGEVHHLKFMFHTTKFHGESWDLVPAAAGNEADYGVPGFAPRYRPSPYFPR